MEAKPEPPSHGLCVLQKTWNPYTLSIQSMSSMGPVISSSFQESTKATEFGTNNLFSSMKKRWPFSNHPSKKVLPHYDHYGFQDIHKDRWSDIVSELDKLSTNLKKRNRDEIKKLCSFCFVCTEEDFFGSFEENAKKLDALIRNLTLWILDTLKKENHIAILGI